MGPSPSRAAALTTIGIVEAARTNVAELARRVDLVVALCHSGISRLASAPGEENAALALARLDGVDAMFLGHQHLLLPGADFAGVAGVDAASGALHGVPAFMPGFWGSHLGLIDLTLELEAGGWRVARAQVEARPIARRDADGAAALVESDAERARRRAGRRMTRRCPMCARRSATRLADPLLFRADRRRSVGADRQRGAERLCRAARRGAAGLASLPILSAAAPFKCGGRGGPDYYTDVARGPDRDQGRRRHLSLSQQPARGEGRRRDLARMAGALGGVFRRIDPASSGEQALIGPAFACIQFRRHRRRDLCDRRHAARALRQFGRPRRAAGPPHPRSHVRGRAGRRTQTFLVVTNNYRASGGGRFPGCDGSTVVIEAPDANREVRANIVETRQIEPKADGNWRFAPWPASGGDLLTSPAAAPPPRRRRQAHPDGRRARRFPQIAG